VWTSSIVTLATMDGRFYGYGIVCIRNYTDMTSVVLKSFEYRRACVLGYGLLLVGRLSSHREIVRGAREFIPWAVKTFDRRGW
jgi:hypothetical protein